MSEREHDAVEPAALDENGSDEHAMEEQADLEARIATLAERVVELETDLETAKTSLERSERERAVDEAVASSGAVDPETVKLLVTRALESDGEATPASAVAGLKDVKPVLFRSPVRAAGPMAARPDRGGAPGLAAAKKKAAEGDRASLLQYLRLRREQA